MILAQQLQESGCIHSEVNQPQQPHLKCHTHHLQGCAAEHVQPQQPHAHERTLKSPKNPQ